MCLHPIHAWYGKNTDLRGVRHIYFTPPQSLEDAVDCYIPLPCGKCIGCLDDRRKRWINRLLLEFDNHKCGSFITLTYNENYVPDRPLKSHFQKFMKRFRNIPRDFGFPPLPLDFKYFGCGECGGERGRPHYHALLFGVDLLADIWKPYIATYDKDGTPRFSSKVLEKKWPYGFCTVDSITSGRCKYIAKYTLKQEGQEHAFTLKSPRLGVSEFFVVQREGRKIKYDFRRKDSLDRLVDGNVHVNCEGKYINVRIPSSILAYLEKVSPSEYFDARMVRQLDAYRYLKNFDKVAYVERLCDENRKQKLKRKLHNEKVSIFNP